MAERALRLGIDVGREATDVVVVDAHGAVVAAAKVPSAPGALASALAGALGELGAARERIGQAVLATDEPAAAVRASAGLRRTAVLRIGGPATAAVAPLAGWPAPLRAAVAPETAIVGGGIEADGSELAPLDSDAVMRFCARVAGRVEACAIVGVFAGVSDRHEQAAAELVRAELGALPIALSSELAVPGLLEREGATVLDAALGGVVESATAVLDAALVAHGLDPVQLLAQANGTALGRDVARRHPALLLGAGPASSIRGAATLAGSDDGVVVDTGSAARIAVLPAESIDGPVLDGLPVRLRVLDLVTTPAEPEAIRRALTLGAVPPAARPVVAVGGRAALVADALEGTGAVVTPANADVAGAVGAALAEVAGQVQTIVRFGRRGRDAALEEIFEAARARAVSAGADPRRTRVVDVDESPLPYLRDAAVHVRVTAVGPAALA